MVNPRFRRPASAGFSQISLIKCADDPRPKLISGDLPKSDGANSSTTLQDMVPDRDVQSSSYGRWEFLQHDLAVDGSQKHLLVTPTPYTPQKLIEGRPLAAFRPRQAVFRFWSAIRN